MYPDLVVTAPMDVSSPTRAEHPSLGAFLSEALSVSQRRSIGLVSFSQWDFTLATLCDVALEAHSMGSAVTIGLWANRTPVRDTAWTTSHRIARLMARTTPRDEAARRAMLAAGLPAAAFARPPIRRWRPAQRTHVPDPVRRSQIRALTYQGSPVGRAILQVHPDRETPIAESYAWPRRWVVASARSYEWAFDQATALIEQRGLTAMVVYNGRFLHDRAVADAAAMAGIPVLFYDSGGSDTDFDLTPAETHDWADLQERMLRMYEDWPADERDAIGASWFLDRVAHKDPDLAVFVEAQTRGLRVDLPSGAKTIAYFSSSGDEIVELDLDWSQYFGSQENALRELADACRARPDCTLIVRTHPHMRLKPREDLEAWTTAVDEAGPDLHLGPDSPADSYELVKQADVVFTYGSTVGVEAAFAGKPVVVMGPNAYTALGCASQITTALEIAAAIEQPPAVHSSAAIPYGLMMRRRGFGFTHVSRSTDGVPTLAGVRLDEPSQTSQKASDALNKIRLRFLIR